MLLHKSILLFLLIKQIFANDKFYQWVQNIQNPSFQCPMQNLKPPKGAKGAKPIIQVVNCEDPEATFRYDFKVSLVIIKILA